jgi:hypothetical protein
MKLVKEDQTVANVQILYGKEYIFYDYIHI